MTYEYRSCFLAGFPQYECYTVLPETFNLIEDHYIIDPIEDDVKYLLANKKEIEYLKGLGFVVEENPKFDYFRITAEDMID